MATKKKMTAEQKIDSEITKFKASVDSYKSKYTKAKASETAMTKRADAATSKARKIYYSDLANKYKAVKDSTRVQYDAKNKQLQSAEAQKSKMDKDKVKKNLATIASNITSHSKKVDAGTNEGKVAIFRSDGQSTDAIYLATTGGESDDTTSDVSSWARDEGSPAKNYARTSGKTVTTTGIITGDTDSESRTKYNKLLQWNSRHYELTYRGKVYYKHLIMTDINRTYDDYATNIKITMTFQFAYTVKVSTSTGTKKTNSNSTSTKTTQGTRSSTYKTITIKSGMTYWALSKTYGKTVKWLESVNKYPATALPIGKKLRVA